MSELQDQAIRQYCKALRMPTIGSQFARLAEAAIREGQSFIGYLEALLAAEMEERENRAVARLLHEARLPRMKTLDAFEFDRSGVSAGQLRTLADGEYVAKADRSCWSARPARGRLTSRRDYAWPPAASDAGFGSRPRPR
jgi:DNA replication protein DnaC